jgi:DNA-binding NarL/FixJ family response regulator
MSTRPATFTPHGTAVDSESIAIVLASREAPARSHLRRLLEDQPDMSVIAETSDLEHVHRHVCEHHPDVVVLAIDPCGLPTLGVLSALLTGAHGTRYVVTNIKQDSEQEALPDAVRFANSSDLARGH